MQARLARAILSSLILMVVVLAGGIISTSSVAGKRAITPHQLTILFTGDDNGNLKPCG